MNLVRVTWPEGISCIGEVVEEREGFMTIDFDDGEEHAFEKDDRGWYDNEIGEVVRIEEVQ